MKSYWSRPVLDTSRSLSLWLIAANENVEKWGLLSEAESGP